MGRGFLKDQIMINILQYINDKDYEDQIDFSNLIKSLKDVDLNNFFDNTEEIITEASKLAFKQLVNYVTEESKEITDKDSKIIMLFSRFVDFYMKNKRSMKLIWFDKVNLEEVSSNKEHGLRLVNYFKLILEEKYGEEFTIEDVQKILHRVHCYCLGEILLFISGRGITNNSDEFKLYLANEMTNLANIYSN
ncbi:MAG: hypothetical protein AB6733_02165 [Clostridiaceae bacterium]